MELFAFIFTSLMLGIGLAMDAFSVSMANGLNEPKMSSKKFFGIAFTFAAFQFIMPVIGWILVHTIISIFDVLEVFIPWIALILLAFIGGKMIIEGIRGGGEDEEIVRLGKGTLIVQGIATSIDALSVGFTIADYSPVKAFLCSMIIFMATFIICIAGIKIGKAIGMKYAGKASIFGGIILLIIGIEIFVKGVILTS